MVEPLTIGGSVFSQQTDLVFHHIDPYWILLIKNVQLRHAGEYQLQISTVDKLTRTVHLNVIGEYVSILDTNNAMFHSTIRNHLENGNEIIKKKPCKWQSNFYVIIVYLQNVSSDRISFHQLIQKTNFCHEYYRKKIVPVSIICNSTRLSST